MANCIVCDTCVSWTCPKCGEQVCGWFETKNGNEHIGCGGLRVRVEPQVSDTGDDTHDHK